jgi:hypothetical protein
VKSVNSQAQQQRQTIMFSNINVMLNRDRADPTGESQISLERDLQASRLFYKGRGEMRDRS